MNTNPVEDWTPAELARWMAECDGWDLSGDYPTHKSHDEWRVLPDYPHSLDAAVGWLGRMGLEWMREPQQDAPTLVTVYSEHHRAECIETPDRPTAHALCIAGVKAKMAKESTDD